MKNLILMLVALVALGCTGLQCSKGTEEAMNQPKVVTLLEQLIVAVKEKSDDKPMVKSSRFTILNDGWILDRATCLEWGPSSKETMNFSDAEKYAKQQGGRLPAVKELFSLVDHEKYDPPIDKDIFTDTKSSWYWTGTEYKPSSGYAWCVGFSFGYVGNDSKGNHDYVRPVRASQCPLTI